MMHHDVQTLKNLDKLLSKNSLQLSEDSVFFLIRSYQQKIDYSHELEFICNSRTRQNSNSPLILIIIDLL